MLIGALAASGILVALVLAVIIVRYGRGDRARPADVIVVLGAGSPGTERRARHAAALYARDLAPMIVCSGGYREAPDQPSEAQRCAHTAQAMGVPAAAFILEETSFNTQQNAQAVAALMAARGWESAVLVTDNFHVWRAAWLFRQEGVTVWPSPAQTTQGALPLPEWAFNVLREVGAVGWHLKEAARDRLGG